MKKQIDQLSSLLKKNHISLPKRANNFDDGQLKDDHERFHAFKARLSRSTTYLIDSGASNHMVSPKDSLTTLNLTGSLTIHMGDDSQIPIV